MARDGRKPSRGAINSVFTMAKQGQKPIINRIKNALVNRLFKIYGNAEAARMGAAVGALSQGQAARQVRQATKELVKIANTNFYYYPTNNNNRVYNKNGNPINRKRLNRTTMSVINSPPLPPRPSGAVGLAALPPSGLPANVKEASNAPGFYFKKSNNGRNVWFPAARNQKTGNWVIMSRNTPHSKNNQNKFKPITLETLPV